MTRVTTFLVLVLWAGLAQAHEHRQTAAAKCGAADTALGCAAHVTPTFAPDGSLHLAWVAGGRVMAARSDDGGRTFATAIAVNPQAETIDANGEARPVIAADGRGQVAVAYAIRGDKGYTGTLMLAHSGDGGRTYAPPRRVTPDTASQRFANLLFEPSGRLLVVWLDKRGGHRSSAVMAAWSDDGGASVGGERVLAERSCECCRIAVAVNSDKTPLLMWRQVLPPNIRDHAIAALRADGVLGPVKRVAEDDWRIDACPHHGPALAVDGAGVSHAAWFTAGRLRQGLFYARGDAAGGFSEPRGLGNPDNAPSHAQVLALGQRVWLAWKEFDGTVTRVMAQDSTDHGASWSAPATLAETRDSSDHPLLVGDAQGRGFLSWVTRKEGWRLLALPGGGS